MSPDENQSDDQLADALAAYDDALAAGLSPRPAADGAAASNAATADPLREHRRVLSLLERVWPRHLASADTPSELDETPTLLETHPPVLGRFRIVRVLGSGGHGIVYLAEDPRLGRCVALKVPRPEALVSPELRRRFVREARAAAGLDHPNLVPIHDADDAGPFCYLVAAYCPGPTLHAWLKHQAAPVAAREAAVLIETLARATQYAHEHGVIHRDLKPANILLQPAQNPASNVPGPWSLVQHQDLEAVVAAASENDQGPGTWDLGRFIPKITDFGLAKLAEADTQPTRSGAVLGTPAYMAPEQADGQGRGVGPASDVYALGAILYELVTGRPPFKAATALDTIMQLLHQEPVPLQLLQPTTPGDLETICLKCLRKEPDKRYATAGELADDLGRFLRGEPIVARPVSWRERAVKWVRRRPALTALAAACLVGSLALVGLAIWFAAEMGNARGKLEGVQAQATAAQELAETRDFYALLSQVRERAAQPEAGWTWANIEDLRRAAALAPARERLVDLRTQAATALGAIDLRPLRTVAEGFTADLVVFDPTGRYLALGQAKTETQETPECLVLLLDGRGRRVVRRLTFRTARVYNPKAGWVQDGVRALVFSADGRWLVAGSRSGWLHRWDLEYGVNAASSWPAHGAEICYLAFSADGKALYSATKSDQRVRRWSCARLPTKDALRLSQRWPTLAPIWGFAAHPREDWVIVASPGPDPGNCALNGTGFALLHSPWMRPHGGIRFLPDGVTLAALDGASIRVEDVREHRLIRHTPAVLPEATDDWIDTFAFPSDGSLLFTASRSAHHFKLWDDVAGGRLLGDVFVAGGTLHGDFAPDGRTLAVPGEHRTLVYEVGGRREQTFLGIQPLPILTCALHPDGRSLACLARSLWGDHTRDITVWPLGDGKDVLPDNPPIRKDAGWWGPAATESVLGSDTEYSMAFSPQQQLLAHTESHGVMVRGNTSRLQARRLPNLEGITDAALCFDPGGRLWGAVDYDVRIWDADFKEQFRWSNAAERERSGLASLYCVAAGRSWAVVGGRDGRLRLFHAPDAALTWTRRAADTPVRSVALHSDETLAAAGSDTGDIRLFQLPAGTTMAKITPHRDHVEALSWSTHGLLASGSRDRKVKLWRWDGSALNELLTFRLPTPVRWLAFHPDGVRLFVLLEGERAVRVWHLDRLWARLREMGLGEGLPVLEPRPLPPPVPEEVPDPLVVDPPRGPNGLRAELFDELGFNHCVKVRYDLPLTFDLGGLGADKRLPISYYSVRWTGWLKPPRPGRYRLAIESTNHVRLWLDGQFVLSRGPRPDETCDVQATLSEHPHALRIEYIKCPYTNRLAVKWEQIGGFPLQPISPLALFHDRATAERAVVPSPKH